VAGREETYCACASLLFAGLALGWQLLLEQRDGDVHSLPACDSSSREASRASSRRLNGGRRLAAVRGWLV
jgi:hypothetical protein